MSKKNKNTHHFPKPLAQPPQKPEPMTSTVSSIQVQPEQMSLSAYQHIQKYLNGKQQLTKEEVTAVLRLSQHLRVFGLLSAVGYLNQAKEGKVQERTAPVWHSLLGQLIDASNPLGKKELMQQVKEMAQQQSGVYMATWRRALILSHQWNFWARAYQED